MLGFENDAGRLRAFLAEGHLLKIPVGDACLVVEVPRYLPWTGAALAVAAVGGWAAWRVLSGRGGPEPDEEVARASAGRASRRGLASRAGGGTSRPRVSRRSRGASVSPSPRASGARARRR